MNKYVINNFQVKLVFKHVSITIENQADVRIHF